MDPREDVALALDDEDRRTSVPPPPLSPSHLSPVPAQTVLEQLATDEPRLEEELPGRRRSRLQYLELYLPQEARELLTRRRSEGVTTGQAVMEALRGAKEWLREEHAPLVIEEDDLFPPPRRPRRRLVVDGGRHVSAGVSPEEAAAIARLAAELDLSLSELVTLAVEHHFAS